MKKHFLVPVLSILSLSSIADASTNNPENVNKLDDVVVTATRTAISADDSIVPVVVIDSEDIARSPAKDLVSLLSGTAGINISNNGGLGKVSSFFMRGTESNHVLVLVDGVRVGSVSTGFGSVEHIPLSEIERIEIVKGPRSSLYGSDAIGGVIQIFTKKGSADQGGITPAITIGVGTDKTHKMNISASGGDDGFSFYLGGSFFNTEGFDATTNVNSGNNSDNDGYSSDSVTVNVGKLWDNGIQLDLMFLQSNDKVEYDSSWPVANAHDSTMQSYRRSIRVAAPVTLAVDMTLQIGESIEDATSYADGVQGNKFESKRMQQSLQIDYQLIDDLLLTMGVDNQQDRIKSTVDYAHTKTKNVARFLQGIYEVGGVSLLAGYRNDDYQTFGEKDTWNIGIKAQITETLSITSSCGTGFKIPTFNELYWPGGGNAELLPEKSKSYELGVAFRKDIFQLQLNMYRTKVEDLISGWPAVNINKAQISGEELILDLNSGLADFALELSHLDAWDQSNDRRLAKRPIKSAKLSVAKKIGAFDVALVAVGYGNSYEYDFMGNVSENGGYGKFGGVVSYDLNKQVSLTLRGDNLFDKEYSTAYGYSSPGRNFMLEMKAGF